jgi:uncharacterized phage protein (TIGR01671 family)
MSNRAYRFRVWDKKGKEMFRVIMLSFPVGRDEIIVSGRGGSISLHGHKEEKYLLQYTGLKDKNGKEIYEGDMVLVYRTDGDIFKGAVEYNPEFALFEITQIKYRSLDAIDISLVDSRTRELEVIGNVYENPELLRKD